MKSTFLRIQSERADAGATTNFHLHLLKELLEESVYQRQERWETCAKAGDSRSQRRQKRSPCGFILAALLAEMWGHMEYGGCYCTRPPVLTFINCIFTRSLWIYWSRGHLVAGQTQLWNSFSFAKKRRFAAKKCKNMKILEVQGSSGARLLA